jgi:thioredoxin reductase (NADPH)
VAAYPFALPPQELEGPMVKPIIIVVDGDEAGRGALEGVLTNRFGTDYEIVPESSTDGCLATLAWLSGRAGTVALVIAAQRTDPADPEFFSRAHALFPGAKRLLIVPMALASPESVLPLLTLGQIDEYFVTPWGHPEEKLYPQITELLSAWVQTVDRPTVEVVKVVGRQWAPRSHQLRDLLERNHVPFGFYTDDSPLGRRLLREAGQDGSRLPVVRMWDGRVLVDPSMADVARAAGTRTQADPVVYDLVIVGAGPAGLAAGVYGASEGLRTLIIEREAQGGQAGTSSMIRNYLGFPRGIGGLELARRATAQAWFFGATFIYNEVVGARVSGSCRVVVLADGSEITTRAVVLATGISYRQLDIPGLDRLAGAGVFYGASVVEAKAMTGLEVYVVGAGNSAGQAAIYLAKYAAQVTIVMRGESLAKSMSDYLIREIHATANVSVRACTVVAGVDGEHRLEGIVLQAPDGSTTRVPASALFVMIGAQPLTGWLDDAVLRDRQGFVLTGLDLLSDGCLPAEWPLRRAPLPMETSVPGVFAVGDVRCRSVKRVASAVGAGAIAVQFVHEYLSLS